MWMNKATGWMAVSLAFFMSAPLSLAAEVANIKACDEITQEVRKGRPGVAPVTVIDGKGPTDSMSRTGLFSSAATPTENFQKKISATFASR